MAIAITVVAACAPAPPPAGSTSGPRAVPTPTTIAPSPTTTIAPSTTTPPLTSLYKRYDKKARAAYKLTFVSGTPQPVVDSLRAAALSVTAVTGITFSPDTASTDDDAAEGEIRVVIGALCSGDENLEAGCARWWWMGNRLMGADISVTSATAGSSYLNYVALHELAHSVGLDHVAFNSAAPQVMNPIVNSGITVFQNGDREGLRLVGLDKYSPGSSMVLAPFMVPSSQSHMVGSPRN